MIRLLLLATALITAQGCIVFPTVPHYEHIIDSRGRVPESAYAFIKDGATPLSEILLSLGEPDWTGDKGRLFAYRWEMVVLSGVTLVSPFGVGPGEYLVIGVDGRGICVKHRTASTRSGLIEVMRTEFGYEWREE